MIRVLSGKGVNEQSVRAFVDAYGAVPIAGAAIRGLQARGLILPGGSCGEWEVNPADVAEFVENGGSCLAVCAGAYFLSKHSIFSLLHKEPLVRERASALFSGRAIGPIFPVVDHRKLEAARALRISAVFGGVKERGCLYYQGGCYFDVSGTPGIEVLAKVDDLPLMIGSNYGKGRFVLCGAHPEFTCENVDLPIALELKPYEGFRKWILEAVFRRLFS